MNESILTSNGIMHFSLYYRIGSNEISEATIVPVAVFVLAATFQNWPFHAVHSPNTFDQVLALNLSVATSPIC